MYGLMNTQINRQTDRYIYIQMDVSTDVWMDYMWIDRWMDSRKDITASETF